MVGEHIRALKGGRWTHAIDCGDETVIHLAGDDAIATRVRRSYRPEFVAGAEVVEVVTHRERTFPASEVVARAYSRISDPGLAAMFHDSEAFADWCVTGRLGAAPQNTVLAVPDVAAEPAPASRESAAAKAPRAPAAVKTTPIPAPAKAKRTAAKARSAPAPAKARRTAAKAKRAAPKARPASVKAAARSTAKKAARKGPSKARRGAAKTRRR